MEIDALRIRRILGRSRWSVPEPFLHGWVFKNFFENRSVIVSSSEWDGVEWIHASMTGDGAVPSYEELVLLHRAVFGDGYAYQVFTPEDEHVNIHEHALHLWGRLDGKPVLPNFGQFGTI